MTIVKFLTNEVWWGISGCLSRYMPLDNFSDLTIKMNDKQNFDENQASPLLLSNKGRYIYINHPFSVVVHNGEFIFDCNTVKVKQNGNTLRDAYIAAKNKYFPFEKKKFPKEFFQTAQYNTWVELMYNQTQDGVLNYAQGIIQNGFDPGILIIDEGWQEYYGSWVFDKIKFPNPKDMIKELHKLGFRVMLWVVPMISPDSCAFRKLEADKLNKHLLRCEDGNPAIIKWWNGYSAILDLTSDCDREFLDSQLKILESEYGVDGFKFDGGSVNCYSDCINGQIAEEKLPSQLNSAWNEFGCKYLYHEFKDSYDFGGRCVIQRLRDKTHKWGDGGLADLIPASITNGLMGYTFLCPDMIGGGDYLSFINPEFILDQELFVRMAQCSAFFPMMQFSLAPWRVLKKENLGIIVDIAKFHKFHSSEIIDEVNNAMQTGEPIIRCMDYSYPNNGYEKITDQFMFSDKYLIAPVLNKGATERKVNLPVGMWQKENGEILEGPNVINAKCSLKNLLYFKKIV